MLGLSSSQFDPLQTSHSDGSMMGMTIDNEPSIYDEVPGGVDLVRWFGRVPSFHDAEFLSLHLHRKGPRRSIP